MQKAQLAQPSLPQAKTQEPPKPKKLGVTEDTLEFIGYVSLYRADITQNEINEWKPGCLRGLGVTMAKPIMVKHPYKEEVVKRLQLEFINDWKGDNHTNGIVGALVQDSCYKKAVCVLDNLRLAQYRVMLKDDHPHPDV
jgi:hypothetical protein